MTATQTLGGTFYGWRVVGAAFVLAVFGWGMGFYGPPVYLSVIHETTGWPLALISTAVTAHFLIGAAAGANLPALYRRFGASAVTKAGAVSLAVGTLGWAIADARWQLFAAALLSGAGWGAMSAVAVNAIVSPWFVRERPAALAMAYNGGSIGGVIFSPLWVAAIDRLGFPIATVLIGSVMAAVMWILAERLLSRTPQQMGSAPDGNAPGARGPPHSSSCEAALRIAALERCRVPDACRRKALGLFAQIGLVAHLFSLLVPVLGAQQAGMAMALATALAIAGRTLVGWIMPLGADRRLVACASCAVQMTGSLAFIAAAGSRVPLLCLGIALFGIGFGNSTSLPPLIAQVEFVDEDVPRVVALIVAIAQAAYAFAPAVFGVIRSLTPHAEGATSGAAPYLFATAALAQGLAIAAFAAGRRR